jgi:hypothetical protein
VNVSRVVYGIPPYLFAHGLPPSVAGPVPRACLPPPLSVSMGSRSGVRAVLISNRVVTVNRILSASSVRNSYLSGRPEHPVPIVAPPSCLYAPPPHIFPTHPLSMRYTVSYLYAVYTSCVRSGSVHPAWVPFRHVPAALPSRGVAPVCPPSPLLPACASGCPLAPRCGESRCADVRHTPTLDQHYLATWYILLSHCSVYMVPATSIVN